MSYCRWSTDIKHTVSWEERMRLLLHAPEKHLSMVKKLQHKRHAELSDWYVFDNCYGTVSVWRTGDLKNNTVDWDYDDLLEAYLYDKVEEAYQDFSQREFIYEIIYYVLAEHYSEENCE